MRDCSFLTRRKAEPSCGFSFGLKFATLPMSLFILRDRLMVGHIPLEDGILVRVQVPQPSRAMLKMSL